MNALNIFLVVLVLYISSPIFGGDAKSEETKFKDPITIGVREDHPWIIKNETCVKEKLKNNLIYAVCYKGFLIDILFKIRDDLNFNFTISAEFNSSSQFDKKNGTWTGVIGGLVNDNLDIGLAPLNITKEAKEVVTFSTPFLNDSKKNITYAIVINKNATKLGEGVSHLISKLENQRYLEQLKEKWFVDYKGDWDEKKQYSHV